MSNSSELEARSLEHKRILIMRLDRIGDVLLSTPVIKAVRDACPDSYIAFMVRPYARDIVNRNPYLADVIIYDKEGNESGLLGNAKFIRHLRKYRFDLALILHPTARTHIIAFLAGIPARIGYDKKWGFLLTNRIPHLKQLGLKHEVDYTLDLVRYIGIEPKDRSLYMPVNDTSENRIKAVLAQKGVKDLDLLVVINPGASCPSKKWPSERFVKVGDALHDKYGARVVVIAGAKDKETGDFVADSMKAEAINLSGRTTVGDLASIIRRAKLMISNDSGPVHVACAVGTPVIAIFGRSDRGLSPKRWGPTGKNDMVLHKDVGCEQCLAHDCKIAFKCLNAVSVEEVLAASAKVLEP